LDLRLEEYDELLKKWGVSRSEVKSVGKKLKEEIKKGLEKTAEVQHEKVGKEIEPEKIPLEKEIEKLQKPPKKKVELPKLKMPKMKFPEVKIPDVKPEIRISISTAKKISTLVLFLTAIVMIYIFFLRSRIISKNPYFDYKEEGLLAAIEKNGWEGNGYHRKIGMGQSVIDVISLHPINLIHGRYITQKINLSPKKSYVLKAGVANIAKQVEDEIPCGDCNDVGVRIKIYDHSDSSERIINDTIIDAKNGWVDMVFDISEYAGKQINITLESYSGGPCGKWCGEWAAVRYFYVQESGLL
jgi:hypothetical protein